MVRKIAIIEDEQAITEMYRLKFESAGYAVVYAADGKKGLELIEKERPDAVLLDLMMPEMTGEEMLAAMRKTDWGKDIPVIVLTNVSQDDTYAALQKLGISNYIVKANYTPQEVVKAVTDLLQTPGEES